MLRRASLRINLNAINDVGLTPLHHAVLEDNLPAVKLLLENGSNINQIDEDTWTPLHAACADGNVEMASFLLDNGGDPTIRTEENERPIDLVDPSDREMVALMLSHKSYLNRSPSPSDNSSNCSSCDDHGTNS